MLNAVQQIPEEVDIQASEEEMKLRHEVAEEERYNVFDQASNKAQKSFSLLAKEHSPVLSSRTSDTMGWISLLLRGLL